MFKNAIKWNLCVLTGYLWTGLSAVHDSVAAVERERVLQLRQTLLCEIVSGVNHPTIRLRGRRTQRPSAAPFVGTYDPWSLRLPALVRRGRGTCLRSTSSWGSWCCSRHTGYTHTGHPTADGLLEYDYYTSHYWSHTITTAEFYGDRDKNVPVSVCPAQTACTAPSLHWPHPSSSGRVQSTCTGHRSYSCPTNTNNPISFTMALVLTHYLCY